MIITDSDAAMTNAVATLLPDTVHLHCLWHVMKNVRKHCKGSLGTKANHFFRLIYAAAFATSDEVSNLGTQLENERRYTPALLCPFAH